MIKIKLKSGCDDFGLKTVDAQKSLLFIKVDDDLSDVYYIVVDKLVRSMKDVISLLSDSEVIQDIFVDDKNPVKVIEKRGLRDIIG